MTEWNIPETEYMIATIHEVPDGDEGNLHQLLNCWCQPEHRREGDKVRTIHHGVAKEEL